MMHALNEEILKQYKNYKGTLKHNEALLCILEGELLKYIEAHLQSEFSGQSFKNIQPRIAPINFLKRIIDKLSKIYQQNPQRIIVDGTDQDQELLDWYVKQMRLNAMLNTGNEYFNTFKNNLNQVYIEDSRPRIRPIASDRFFVYSTNRVDRTIPTQVLLPLGKKVIKNQLGKPKEENIYRLYSDESIVMVDDQGRQLNDPDNPEGINPFGTLNGLFMYVNRSPNFLLPPMDSDTMRMTLLIPVLLSDLNYAVKYQAFSILYGINVDNENLAKSPEAFWMFKTDPGDETKPEVGQIKPQVDITDVIQLITTELSMWLNSRNIRPGSISDVSAENMVSGISKLVDEMDTSDDRKKQAEIYSTMEERWWHGIMHSVHPYWVNQRMIDTSQLFSANARVEVSFPEQLPTMRRGQIVNDLKTEVEAGFISRKSAMRKLNPEWTQQRLDAELQEIENPITLEIESEG
jgi:hypothetical protein